MNLFRKKSKLNDIKGFNRLGQQGKTGNPKIPWVYEAKASGKPRQIHRQLLHTGPVSNSNSGTATPAYRTKQDPSVNLGIVATQSGRPNPGLIIEKVAANSPAAAAGLKTADRIVAFGGASIGKIADLQMILTALAPGDRAVIEFFRDNQNKNALVEFPLKPSLKGPKQPTNKTGPPADNELLPAPLNSTPQVNPTPPDNLDKNASRVAGKSSGSVVNKAGLGVVAVTVDPVIAQLKGLSVRQGAMLDDVLVNSAADTAGLRKGDTVIAMDGRRVNSAFRTCRNHPNV